MKTKFVICSCGVVLKKNSIHRHLVTLKHINFIIKNK